MKLAAVQANYENLATRRQDAIIEALEAGNSLRAVAEAARCSYESVRRLAGPEATIFEWNGGTYVMTFDVSRVLEYKADGFASGKFHNESAEQINAGTMWQTAAAELLTQLRRSRRGDTKVVELTDGLARALYLILTATYTGRPSRLADLYDDLRVIYRVKLSGATTRLLPSSSTLLPR